MDVFIYFLKKNLIGCEEKNDSRFPSTFVSFLNQDQNLQFFGKSDKLNYSSINTSMKINDQNI